MANPAAARSRGQMLIITGLLLAVLLVGLATVLNGAIYTENLASRSDDDNSLCSPGPFQHEVRGDLVELIDRNNARTSTTNRSKVVDELNADIRGYSNTTKSVCATRGSWAGFDVRSTDNGTRLRQTNESRDFTDANGNWDWTLTSGVPDGGQFVMAIQSQSLYEDGLSATLSTLAGEAFAVEFHLSSYGGSGDGIWRVYFYQSSLSDNVYAVVEQPDQNFSQMTLTDIDDIIDQTCIARGDTVSVRFSESLYGGKPCSELAFYNNIDAHEVAFKNARTGSLLSGGEAQARGTYDILVESTTFNEPAFNEVGNGQPFYQAAVASLNYDASVEADDSQFTISNTTVVPRKHDGGGILRAHPNVDNFEYTDRTDAVGDPTFDITWNVSDIDGDLERVELYLVHADDERIVDSAQYSVSGHAASGTETFDDTRLSATSGDEYRIAIGVIDEDGRATMISELEVAG